MAALGWGDVSPVWSDGSPAWIPVDRLVSVDSPTVLGSVLGAAVDADVAADSGSVLLVSGQPGSGVEVAVLWPAAPASAAASPVAVGTASESHGLVGVSDLAVSILGAAGAPTISFSSSVLELLGEIVQAAVQTTTIVPVDISIAASSVIPGEMRLLVDVGTAGLSSATSGVLILSECVATPEFSGATISLPPSVPLPIAGPGSVCLGLDATAPSVEVFSFCSALLVPAEARSDILEAMGAPRMDVASGELDVGASVLAGDSLVWTTIQTEFLDCAFSVNSFTIDTGKHKVVRIRTSLAKSLLLSAPLQKQISFRSPCSKQVLLQARGNIEQT